MMVTAVTLIFTFTLSNGSNRQETRVQSGQERKEVEKPIRTVTEKAQQRNFQAAQHTPHQMRKTPVYLAKEQQSRILEDKDIKPRDPDVRSRDQDSTLHRLRDHALKVNMEEKVLNLEKLADENGDTLQLDKHGVVLAVQVHNRSEYFAHFVASLKFVKNIEQVLLVVSHDYYSPEIESLVASITVCKVIQIFYPHSMQLYPDKFPGQDPNDCARDTSREIAKRSGCNNADHPDQYGHYREAKFTMTKHHWWWKAHHIFDHMRLTHNFQGYVVFLEEDHYLAPDFVYMVNKMAESKPKICPKCDFIGLGVYDKPLFQEGTAKAVRVFSWMSGKHNMGFAMDRDTWNIIKGCNKVFFQHHSVT
jgi:alpha-1,6-mannosyl-glycoprotein beta-1,2-N-acetylglucosaminyltransferase